MLNSTNRLMKAFLVGSVMCVGLAVSSELTDTMTLDEIEEQSVVVAGMTRQNVLNSASFPVAIGGDAAFRTRMHVFSELEPWAQENRRFMSGWTEIKPVFFVNPNRHTSFSTGLRMVSYLPGRTFPNAALGPLRDSCLDSTGMMSITGHHLDHWSGIIEPLAVYGNLYADASFQTTDLKLSVRMGGPVYMAASPLICWGSGDDMVWGEGPSSAWPHSIWESPMSPKQRYWNNVLYAVRLGNFGDRWSNVTRKGVNASVYLPKIGASFWTVGAKTGNHSYEIIDRVEWDMIKTTSKNLRWGLNYASSFHAPSHVARECLLEENSWRLDAFYRDNSSKQNWRQIYYDYQAFGADVKGKINARMEIHADVAVSFADSNTLFYLPTDTVVDTSTGETAVHYATEFSHVHEKKSPVPAFYLLLSSAYGIPLQFEGAYIPTEFQSSKSFHSGMLGFNLEYKPTTSNGHFWIVYGQQRYLYRTQDLFSSHPIGDFVSLFPYTEGYWSSASVDSSLIRRLEDNGISDIEGYKSRIGDERYRSTRGGLHASGDTYMTFRSIEQARAHVENARLNPSDETYVPYSEKWISNMSIVWAYNVGSKIGLDRRLLVNCYANRNTTSVEFKPAPFGEEHVLVANTTLQFEPSIEITESFYVTALSRFTWRESDKTYMELYDGSVVKSPVDFRTFALGIGFDSELTRRTTMYGRYEWTKHMDMEYRDHDWKVHRGEVGLRVGFW